MKKLKVGTPAMGFAIGGILVTAAVLIMLIGFWKAALLILLFAIGYFLGAVENKLDFFRKGINSIFPPKEAKMIDIKSEITREQEERQGMVYTWENSDKDGE